MKKIFIFIMLLSLIFLPNNSGVIKAIEDSEIEEVSVRGVVLDPNTNTPIVVLVNRTKLKALPIAIGVAEAQAISSEIESIVPVRPMTHDLIRNIFEKLHAKIIKIVITDMKNNIFYASLHVKQNSSEFVLDARPSDAIAIALRMKANIFVSKKILNNQGIDLKERDRKNKKEKILNL